MVSSQKDTALVLKRLCGKLADGIGPRAKRLLFCEAKPFFPRLPSKPTGLQGTESLCFPMFCPSKKGFAKQICQTKKNNRLLFCQSIILCMKPAWLQGTNVVAIVPAYNEANFIENIVRKLRRQKEKGMVSEIVVADDGSTDRTGKIAKRAGADKVIRLKTNKGKSWAVATAASDIAKRHNLANTIILTLDAEVESVSKTQLEQLLKPLVRHKGRVNMVIGSNDYTGKSYASYSGQRAIRLNALGGLLKKTKKWRVLLEAGYGLEVALNQVLMNHELADTNFKMGLRVSQTGRQFSLKSTEPALAFEYLHRRKMIAKKLANARQRIKEMPREEKRTARRAQLSVAERREKMARERMNRSLRRAKIKARHIKYTVRM